MFFFVKLVRLSPRFLAPYSAPLFVWAQTKHRLELTVVNVLHFLTPSCSTYTARSPYLLLLIFFNRCMLLLSTMCLLHLLLRAYATPPDLSIRSTNLSYFISSPLLFLLLLSIITRRFKRLFVDLHHNVELKIFITVWLCDPHKQRQRRTFITNTQSVPFSS